MGGGGGGGAPFLSCIKADKYHRFHFFLPFNCCLKVVLQLEKGAYHESWDEIYLAESLS